MTMSHIYIAVYFGFWRCLQESAAFLRLEKNYNENLWLSFEKKPERGYTEYIVKRGQKDAYLEILETIVEVKSF